MTGIPFVNLIFPLFGSIYGGTLLNISGNGFDYGTQVFLQNVKCNITYLAINNIQCLTGPRIQSTVNIIIK